MTEMNHQEAVSSHAAERYLLEELSAEERAGFEEHYFGCVECADEVRAAFIFADNAKAVLAEKAVTVGVRSPVRLPKTSGFWDWLKPSFAVPVLAVLLLTVTLYQSLFVIPELQRRLETATSPRAIPAIAAKSETRGTDSPVVLSADDPFLQVFLDINMAHPVSSYLCNVYDESGTLRFAVNAQAGSAARSLNLLLPAAGLQSGRYTVKVIANGGSAGTGSSDNYSFVVQRK